ncbi:MAG TPA: hypothetical protein VFH23_10020, partial [Jiangellaceae bacterium]|nr:hypothetical protein [Jiangellaceae bacterium]
PDTEDQISMPDGSVRAQLLARVDEITSRLTELVAEVREVTEQLEPERARSCRNAITMASVMVDEIRLRAHARPLDSDE